MISIMKWSAFLFAVSAAAQKTPISQELFDRFVHYAAISSAVYAADCPNPPGGIEIKKVISNGLTNTNGWIAVDNARNEVILAIRGTSNGQDLITDLNLGMAPFESQGVSGCTGCMVHSGFQSAWNSVSAEAINAIQAEVAAKPGRSVVVTGHSLGGAMASLATMSLRGSGFNTTTYTFGMTRTGNQAYADFVDRTVPKQNMFRITHSNDGVPQAFTNAMGYQHHSTEYWQPDKNTAAETFECVGQEPKDCNNSVLGLGIGFGFPPVGINLAHIEYMGMTMGNPTDKGATACNGPPPGFIGTIGGLIGIGGRDLERAERLERMVKARAART